MSKIKVSIVTVVYNTVSNIEKTILSVINQTYPQIEYIIIDGGSTDGTVDIIKKYEDRITYWISERDNGIYDAMNKGIKKATGEWINFMNAGDTFYTTNIIEELINKDIFDNSEGGIIYGNREVDNNGIIKKQLSKLDTIKYSMEIFHQSCFIYTSLHKKYLFDTSYKIAGDYDFFYKMINKKVQFVKIDTNICMFLDGGISCNNIIQLKEVLRVISNNNSNKIYATYFSILCIFRKYSISILLQQYFPYLHKTIRNIYLKLK